MENKWLELPMTLTLIAISYVLMWLLIGQGWITLTLVSALVFFGMIWKEL